MNFVKEFQLKHPELNPSSGDVVRFALGLLKITEMLEQGSTLTVMDKDTGINRHVVLPWRDNVDHFTVPLF